MSETTPAPATRGFLVRYAWLSIAAALATIVLKLAAYALTDSVGLLSDALESVVNLAGAVMALCMLVIAARPPDDDHAHGHDKAEYFSSGVEGTLILIAAAGIAWAAFERLRAPRPLEQIGAGLAVSITASAINFAVARVLLRVGRRERSITLEADAQHLMTDVWTSVGVVTAVGLVALTGWQRLDPIVALLVAANIVFTGVGLVRRSTLGLLDTALPPAQQDSVRTVLDRYAANGVQYHALRTRQAGARRFVSVHVLVPGEWTVQRGHDLLERMEAEIRSALPGASVLTHLEPKEDASSWEDQALDRAEPPARDLRPPR